VFRRVREAYGLTPAEVARLLKIGRATYYRVERPGGRGGSPGLLLALGGLGLGVLGWGVARVAAPLGIDPDAGPVRTPGGRYAPWIPPADLPPVPARPTDGARAELHELADDDSE
jgi:transcriptional regulator with XRE-family HTH domain